MKGTDKAPLVSVIMANYRGERFLEASLASVLAQSVTELELIVSDDGSDDASLEIISKATRNDSRVRLVTGAKNTGPGATRNRALEIARGTWIAIVDSDDLMSPDRFQSLIDLAEANDCEIAADDLAYFRSESDTSNETLFGNAARKPPEIVTADILIESEVNGSGLPKLGYLKPIIRRSALDGIRYNENLRVGEDFDLLLRLLLKGARLFVTPVSYYRYRRHGSSISHRLSEEKVLAMIATQRKMVQEAGSLPSPTSRLLALRLAALEELLAYERLVQQIKQRNLTAAARSLLRQPTLAANLTQSLAENLSRRFLKRGGAGAG